MRKKNLYLCLLMLCVLIMSPMKVSADIGPKPSVVIEFAGLESEEYYVTLLSENASTGPWSERTSYSEYMGDKSVFQKFKEYKDADGYYFLGYMEGCSEDDTFAWTYYPPSTFKILIYFPEYDKFLMAEDVCERYAFDSYFAVEVTGVDDAAVVDVSERKMETTRSYDFSMELLSLAARVIVTIAIEVGIALLFAYRDKKSLVIITIANIFTQVILNVLLNIINYRSGQYAFAFHYVWMEMVVFVIEAIIYAKLVGGVNKATGKKYHPCLYAAAANIVSFIAGMWIARVIPGIF